MYYTNDSLRSLIMESLAKEPFLDGFKVVRSKNSIIKKDSMGYYAIEISGYTSVDIYRNTEVSLMISPRYYRYFKVLDNWNGSIISVIQNHKGGLVALNMKPEDKMNHIYDFLRTGEDFDSDYRNLCSTIKQYALPFFEQFSSLKGMYDNCIIPLLRNEQPKSLSTLIPYYYLVLTKIIAPEKLDAVKECIIKQRETCDLSLYNLYYDNLDQVFDYIKSTSFKV